MDWVRRYNDAEFPIRIATLSEYVHQVSSGELVRIEGELRNHARGNVLPEVISIRLGHKEAMALAERTLGEAERLAAHWSAEDFAPFLERS